MAVRVVERVRTLELLGRIKAQSDKAIMAALLTS